MENENVMADKINDGGSPFGVIFIIENYNTIDRVL